MGNYIYILCTIIFTVYGQIVLKWRISDLGLEVSQEMSFIEKLIVLVKLVFDPFIFSGFVSAFVASIFWMGAMSKFEITHAYPFMSLSPALVFLIGVILLGETFTIGKLIGLVLIIAGIVITVKF